MKKILMSLAVVGLLAISADFALAQDATKEAAPATEVVENATDSTVQAEPAMTEEAAPVAPEQEEEGAQAIHQALKTKFIEGGPEFMAAILCCLIFGLAIAIERIIYLNLASTNNKKLLEKIEKAMQEGNVEEAKNICRNTRGPVASIFYQGLMRMDEGVDVVEKAVVSYGSVQMGRLESGLTWVSLFIAVAPMLGFMGTVLGMIGAFDAIEAAGDISPAVVAGGIKVALITTVAGLIVATILQIFYNYLISKVSSLVIEMEDSSIKLVDIVVKAKTK